MGDTNVLSRPGRLPVSELAALVAQPHIFLLHGCMLLSGFGTVFLGPVLPALITSAQTTDRGGGFFFTAQFLGAFLGGVTTTNRLWRSLIRGTAAASLGFLFLGLGIRQHATVFTYAAALVILGFGVGQMLTSTNLLASRRFPGSRGAALAKVNFTWSLGALLGPFLLSSLLSYTALATVLSAAAVFFALACAAAVWNSISGQRRDARTSITQQSPGLSRTTFAYFACLLLLYGGVETSLSGWITTFGTRYSSGTLRTSSLAVTALWSGITAGRAVTPALLKKISDRHLLTAALAGAAVFVALLSQASGAIVIIASALLLGLALAPWFPLVLAGMLGEAATATQAGTVIAVSGIGAALLPLLVGELSHAAHSLRSALFVPFSGLLVLLALSFRSGRNLHRT